MEPITLEECLEVTATLRAKQAKLKKAWFDVKRGQLLKFTKPYFDKKIGDFALVVKDSANHEIFISLDPKAKYVKYHAKSDSFEPASEAEIKKHFGQGAESEKSAEEAEPNKSADLNQIDGEDAVTSDSAGGEISQSDGDDSKEGGQESPVENKINGDDSTNTTNQ